MFDWLVLGEDPNDLGDDHPIVDDAPLLGLHWEVGSTINEPP